jgi:hypothetical protein
VASDARLDDDQRKGVAQLYSDAAMQLLRDAVRKGYRDVAHMKKDTDLGPLRPREDCQMLIAQLRREGEIACGRRAAGRRH